VNVPGLLYSYEVTYQPNEADEKTILALEKYECAEPLTNGKKLNACLSIFNERFSDDTFEFETYVPPQSGSLALKLEQKTYLIGLKIVVATRHSDGQTSVSNQYLYHIPMHDEM